MKRQFSWLNLSLLLRNSPAISAPGENSKRKSISKPLKTNTAQNLALVKIVKKVEENWVSTSVGDKGTRTFWETAVAAAAPLFPDRQQR